MLRILAATVLSLPGAALMIAFSIDSLNVAPPGTVIDLRVAAVTDTSVVLVWTEVTSGTKDVARYTLRAAPQPFAWAKAPTVTTGGCAYPVTGSTAKGGQTRACVVGGLKPNLAYGFQVAIHSSSTRSNVATATTATRVGPMVVSRTRIYADTVPGVRSVEVSRWGVMPLTFPLTLRLGDYAVTFTDSAKKVVALGHLLVVKP